MEELLIGIVGMVLAVIGLIFFIAAFIAITIIAGIFVAKLVVWVFDQTTDL